MKRILTLIIFLSACSTPVPGPDKQFEGMASGGVVGAGTGMVTGFQVGAGLGPAAFVGAGLGAIMGGFKGWQTDELEDKMMQISSATKAERAKTYAQEILAEHYKIRSEIHPARDIFPADIFFRGDEVFLRPGALAVLKEIAFLDKDYLPWSRLVVAVYVKSKDPQSGYANHLVTRRSRAIVNALVQFGLDPRRLVARGIVVPAPIVIDPEDRVDRYSQAVEFIAEDN